MITSLMFAAHAGLIINVIGVFYAPVGQDLGLLTGEFALHHTITLIVIGIVGIALPNIIDKIGWKKTIIPGVILSFIGLAGMAFTNNLIHFYILGAIRGIGAATFGLVAMTMFINNWFDEKNGLSISIASSFSGITGVIFAPIFSNIIESFGWRIGFIVMGILVVLLTLPAILYSYSISPEEENLLPYGYKIYDNEENLNKSEERINENINFDYKRSLIAMIMFSLLHSNITGITQHLSIHGISVGMVLKLSGYILSAVMLGNIVFKIVSGPLSDKIGSMKSTIYMNIINTIGLLILILSSSYFYLLLASFLYGSVFSVGAVTLPLISKDVFGNELSTKLFPILNLASSTGIAISNTLVGFIYDFSGTYRVAFIIGILFHIINLALLFIAKKNGIIKKGKS